MAYLALNHSFRFVADDPALITRATAALGALAQVPDSDDDKIYELGDELTVDALIQELNTAAAESRTDAVLLHAAGLVDAHNKVVALVGRSGAGKTTLCTTLLRDTELRYLSDETVPVNPTDLDVAAYPKPLTLKAGSHARFPEFEGSGESVWNIEPGRVRRDCVGRGGRLAVVVTPRWEAGAATRQRALTPGELVIAMAENSSYLLHHDEPLATLASIAGRVKGYELVYDDAHDAAPLVLSLLAGAR